MAARRSIVGGNWKMNLDLALGVELAEDVAAGSSELIDACDIAIFPPAPYLQAVGKAVGHHGVIVGAQNVYHEPSGAFTGEISAGMLNDLNVEMVIIGHSERRHVLGETDELINAKVRTALDAGLGVILCVGETLQQREAGETDRVNINQLRRGLEGVTYEMLDDLVIAYEPVWAIGTGNTATPDDANAVHALIRSTISELFGDDAAQEIRIQYGGSVKPANAAELISQPDIDGFLVGGASLKADDFLAIIRAAATVN